MDFTLAWRNIWRNPRRSILTMSAIAFACLLLVFMLSWQFGSYETMINASVKIHTGHIQVRSPGYNEDQDIRKVVADPKRVKKAMREIPRISAHTLRAEAFSLISSRERTYGALITGIDPDLEKNVSTLDDVIREGDYLDADDTNSALIGKLMARNLKVGLGDELVILGQGRDGSVAATVVTVKGIFSAGLDEFDRGLVHIPLAYFQEVFSMRGAVHSVVAICDSLADVKKAASVLKNELEKNGDLAVQDWKDLNPGLVQAIKMDLTSGFIFYIILIVVVAFSILNTFLMAIFERTREFGVMLSMGTTPGRLSRILLLESFGITTMGSILGIILGSLLTWYFQVHGIVIPGASEFTGKFGLPERLFPQLSALSICVGAGIVLVITFLTSSYPALKVRRLRPVQALNSV